MRTFGQLIGHVADAQYTICSIALGERGPAPNVEKTKTSKADLIAALKEAFAYCDRAYDSMTDAAGSRMVNLFGSDAPRLGVLTVNNLHNFEHYGNLVVSASEEYRSPTSEPACPAIAGAIVPVGIVTAVFLAARAFACWPG